MVGAVGVAVTGFPVVALSDGSAVHVYVEAPLAVRTEDPPEQTKDGSAETDTEGKGLTVMVDVAVAVHPARLAPVTVYTVLADGFAVTTDPVVALKLVLGDQL